MRCSKCGAINPDGAKFCIECASPFPRRRTSCGTENSPRAKFCLECRKALETASTELIDTGKFSKSRVLVSEGSDDAPLDGERKIVTALFADIKGSMELIEDLDPEGIAPSGIWARHSRWRALV
jgi:ribosomal protein L40E